MRGLSEDLRERIVRRYGDGKRAEEVAVHFEVSVRSVYRFVKLSREGERLAAQKPGGKQSILERKGLGLHETLRELVKADSEARLQDYVARLQEQTGVVMSIASMCRALKKLGLTRKKRPSSPRNVTKPAA